MCVLDRCRAWQQGGRERERVGEDTGGGDGSHDDLAIGIKELVLELVKELARAASKWKEAHEASRAWAPCIEKVVWHGLQPESRS